jgi:hypothetical protein
MQADTGMQLQYFSLSEGEICNLCFMSRKLCDEIFDSLGPKSPPQRFSPPLLLYPSGERVSSWGILHYGKSLKGEK